MALLLLLRTIVQFAASTAILIPVTDVLQMWVTYMQAKHRHMK